MTYILSIQVSAMGHQQVHKRSMALVARKHQGRLSTGLHGGEGGGAREWSSVTTNAQQSFGDSYYRANLPPPPTPTTAAHNGQPANSGQRINRQHTGGARMHL